MTIVFAPAESAGDVNVTLPAAEAVTTADTPPTVTVGL